MSLLGRVITRLNGVMEPVLQSGPVLRLFRVEACEIRYRGRRSGRLVEFPAWCKRSDRGVRIEAGMPQQKVWWRNFRGTAHPIQVKLDGTWHSGTGLVEERDDKVVVAVTFED